LESRIKTGGGARGFFTAPCRQKSWERTEKRPQLRKRIFSVMMVKITPKYHRVALRRVSAVAGTAPYRAVH